MPKPLKVILAVAALVVDAVVIVLSLLLMVAGYPWWGGVALLVAFGSLVAAAWYWRRTPQPPGDPVDAHAVQMIRALSGQPAVLPEYDLLQPPRRNRRRENPEPKSLGGN